MAVLRSCLAALFVALAAAASARAGEAGGPGVAGGADDWRAGAYSFSDELGGFRILSVAGSGTREDPAVITQEFYSASPVTLVTRATAPIRPLAYGEGVVNGFLCLKIEAVNASGLAWSEFEFELQQTLRVPSIFGDGLSFDQRRQDGDTIGSESFARFERDYEPYDRLLFTRGFIDPAMKASFRFLVSDFTPEEVFYLVQDPRVPSS